MVSHAFDIHVRPNISWEKGLHQSLVHNVKKAKQKLHPSLIYRKYTPCRNWLRIISASLTASEEESLDTYRQSYLNHPRHTPSHTHILLTFTSELSHISTLFLEPHFVNIYSTVYLSVKKHYFPIMYVL